MKKTLTFSLLAALGFVALPFSECKADTPAPAAPAAVQSSDHVALANSLLTALDELVSILASVQDTASADAAAQQLVPVINKLKEITAAGQTLGEPSAEAAAVLEGMKPQVQNKMGAMIQVLMPIAMNNFFDSEALKTTLEGMN